MKSLLYIVVEVEVMLLTEARFPNLASVRALLPSLGLGYAGSLDDLSIDWKWKTDRP
jgi:hypothetical protein